MHTLKIIWLRLFSDFGIPVYFAVFLALHLASVPPLPPTLLDLESSQLLPQAVEWELCVLGFLTS